MHHETDTDKLRGETARDLEATHQTVTYLKEGLPTGRVASVEDSAIHKHNAHVFQGVVGVLRDPAAHARAVIGDDAANHAAINGGGVRPDLVLHRVLMLVLVRSQYAVHLTANESGLHGNGAAIILQMRGGDKACIYAMNLSYN
jgi:hypothetical protein